MQQRRASVLAAVAAAILACTGLLLFGGSPLPAAAGVIQQVGATPMAAQGTVTTGPLGVRAEPALTSRVIGTLPAGSQVNVLDQQGSWYQIEYAPGPGGKGWVSARFVRIGSGNTSTGTDAGTNGGSAAPSAAKCCPGDDGTGAVATAAPATATAGGGGTGAGPVPAPQVVDYQPPVLRWKWAGDTAALGNKDWFFDVLVIQKYDAYPYWTQFVEPPGKPHGALQQGDIYSVTIQAANFRCDSSFAVQVALRENGRFAEWFSPRSNLLQFTPDCPPPTPTLAMYPEAPPGNGDADNKPIDPGSSTGDEGQTNPNPMPMPPAPDAGSVAPANPGIMPAFPWYYRPSWPTPTATPP